MTDKTLFDYWMVCYRRRLVIFVLMLSAIVCTLLIGASLPSIYEARAMFYVPASAATQRSNTGDNAVPLPASNQDDAKANIGVLKGRDALRSIHAAFPNKSIDALQRDVDFTAGRDGIISVYVRDRDPALAAAIANAYVAHFNRFMIGQMQQRMAPKLAAMQRRMAELNQQLDQLAKTRLDLVNISGTPLIEVETAELMKERKSLLRELDDLRDNVVSRLSNEQRGERTRLLATPAVDEVERQLALIDSDLARARTHTLPDHPEQQALLERRRVTEATLQAKLGSLTAGDKSRMESLASQLSRRDRQLKLMPLQQQRLDELNVQYRDTRSALSFLKTSLEEAWLGGIRPSQVAISTETAEAPAVPVFPIAWLNVIVASVVSLLVGMLYALLLDYIDDMRRNRAALAATTGI